MSKSLRIAVFVGAFPVISETFILRQITGLLDRGHQVDIYANERPEAGAPLQPEIIQHGLLERTTYTNAPPEAGIWEMPVWPITAKTWPPGQETPIRNVGRVWRAIPALLRCFTSRPRLTLRVLSAREFGYQASSLSALYRLAQLASLDRRYDVLHAHFGPVGNTFRFAKGLWKAPFIVTFHGYDFSSLPKQEGPHMYAKLFSEVNMVTVNSLHARQKIEELGCASEKIRQLNMGLPAADFPYREGGFQPNETVRLLTVGRLVEKKGLEYSIQAVMQLARAHRVQYDIVGEGPLRGSLAELIDKLDAGSCVKLHGAQSGDVVRKMMAAAHLFVLASVTAQDGDEEGTPVSLMEAQAVGMPVVATFHGGIPEIVLDGQSGMLVPERDVRALSEALKFLVEHPQKWREMGRAGRNHVEQHFDVEKLNGQLLALYQEAISSAGSH